MKIKFPNSEEILQAIKLGKEFPEELSDREIWILNNLEGDFQ
jgi:hypothetical protein